MKPPKAQTPVSHGVDQLIAQLRAEGVAAGREEAAAIVAEARAKADAMRAAARAEIEADRRAAAQDAERAARTAREALDAALRDAMLALRGQLLERFSEDVRRLVAEAAAEPDLIARMILEVAAGAREAAGVVPGEPIEALLPISVARPEDLRRDLEGLRQSPLTQLTLARAGAILEEGVPLGPGGLTLRLRDGALEIDLSDEAIADVILSHLKPRFRALFEGVIR